MEKIKVNRYITLFALAALIFSFVSCNSRVLREDFRDTSFKTLISFCENGINISAYLTATKNRDGTHDIELEVISPKTLSGFTVHRENGTEYSEFEGIRLSSNNLSTLLQYADIIFQDGDIFIVSKTELDGRSVLFATLGRNDPNGYEIYLDPDTYIPIEITLGNKTVHFSEFVRLV